jgi:hypothetical protein
MNPIDQVTKSFSIAFDSIINTKIYFRSNRMTLLQAGIILILPQMSAYLLEYNKALGIDMKVKLQSYPLLLFLLLASTIYVLLEPRMRSKRADDVFRLAFLSIHIFAFALSINLIYAVLLQVFGIPDFLRTQIQSAATSLTTPLKPATFAAIYGLPFLILSVALVFRNSYRRAPKRMRTILRAPFFWRTFVICVALAIYQYMAFILIGASAQ